MTSAMVFWVAHDVASSSGGDLSNRIIDFLAVSGGGHAGQFRDCRNLLG